MKKLLVFLLILLSVSTVCLAEDYNGYIVKITENAAYKLSSSLPYGSASLMSDMTDSEVVEMIANETPTIEEINSEHMLVKALDDDTLEELVSLGIVESYEKNFYLELCGAYDVTQNANYSDQEWYLDYINADFAWDAGIYGSNDVLVAVIDSGVYAHDDLKRNLLEGKNYVDTDIYGTTDTHDYADHGTHVASIIASECNNLATVGIAFKSKIVPFRVTTSDKLELSYAVDAIYDAVKLNCDVINLSFGSVNDSQKLEEAINYAISKNVIVVAAAGNYGDTGYYYPASYENVVSVANAQKNGDSLEIKSTSQRNDKVDIASVGTGVYSVSNTGAVSGVSGTSFSCPMVSAVAALAKSVNRNISQSEFESLIKSSADDSYIAASGQDFTAWGAGLLDIKEFFLQMFEGDKTFVSNKFTLNGDTLVYVTNLSDTEAIEKGFVILSEYDAEGILVKSESFPVSIAAGENKAFSITGNGFSSSAAVRVVSGYLPGDVNGDGEVSIRDASAILKYKANQVVSVVEDALDANGDGEVNIRDASAILRFCAGDNVELY